MNVNCPPSTIAPLQHDVTTHWGPTAAFASRGTLMLAPAIREPAVEVGLLLVRSETFYISGLDATILPQTPTMASSLVPAESPSAYTDLPLTFPPTMNTTNSSASNTANYPQGNSSAHNSGTTNPSPTSPSLNYSRHLPTASTPASTTGSHLPTSACCKNHLTSQAWLSFDPAQSLAFGGLMG